MTIPIRFARHQRPVLRGMGELALAGLVPGVLRGAPPSLPGEWIERRVPPIPDALIDAYVEHVSAGEKGAARATYANTVPPHLFPHWAFPMSGELMRGLRYPLLRAVNAGCKLEVRDALPRGRELIVRGRLAAIDDDGKRAIITQRFTTGVEGATQLVVAEVRVFVPLARKRRKKEDAGADTREPPRPTDRARELGRFSAGAGAGWEFALLTGDFNPIHWARPWARVSGFPSVILHGFGTFARAWEIAEREGALRSLDARFTRPLVLPAEARVLGDERRLWVVDARGGVVMEGSVER